MGEIDTHDPVRDAFDRASDVSLDDAPEGWSPRQTDADPESNGPDTPEPPITEPDAPDAPEPSIKELTEDGIARAFTAQHGDLVRFVQDAGRWLRWDVQRRRWVWDNRRLVKEWLRLIVRGMSAGQKAAVLAKLRKNATIAGVEQIARCDPIHSTLIEDLDPDVMLLGCDGVTVDLSTGRKRDPDPKDMITRFAAVAPDFTAECPRFHAFLEEATGGDEELIEFLQVWAGYCLTGHTREHKVLFLHGEGRNGKSVFLNTMAGIMGDYAQTAAMESFTASRYERHSTALAALRGARLVTVSEVEEGRGWDEQRIKAISGGDTIRVRFMRQDGFEYRPQFKLTIVGNHKPTLRNVDEAMKRRLRLVPFNHRPAKPDPDLEKKLRAEWPAILAWMIRGCAAWLENELPEPRVVADATAEYFDTQDTFGAWLAECCNVDRSSPHAWDKASDLFASWKSYAEAQGERAGTQKVFGDQLAQRGFTRVRERVDGDRVRCWHGLSLRRSQSYGSEF
jgi:putative DNA primase/helicase